MRGLTVNHKSVHDQITLYLCKGRAIIIVNHCGKKMSNSVFSCHNGNLLIPTEEGTACKLEY